MYLFFLIALTQLVCLSVRLSVLPSVCLRVFVTFVFCLCLRELYEADFHKLRICESGRVWANAWDVFRRTPSRVGRGRRAAVDFVVCIGSGGFFRVCVFVCVCVCVCFFLRTHTACCKYEAALPHLPLY